MKTALITGASGYLGGHVAKKLLSQGWRVVAITRPASRLRHDIKEQTIRFDYDGTLNRACQAFESYDIDVVVHLASAIISVHKADEVDTLIDANVRMPSHLLEAMRQNSCRRFVNTASFWQFCNSDSYNPVNLYAATKQAFEDIARTYVENDNLIFDNIILYDTYGEDDSRRKIVRLLIDSVQKDSEVILLSPGQQVLDLLHAEDVANAFQIACNDVLGKSHAGWSSYRVSGSRLSLADLVELVSVAAGSKPNVSLGAMPYRNREIMLPMENAAPLLPNWRPEHCLKEDIAAMLDARRNKA